MAGSLILVANPGSASRKYALYEGVRVRGELHFEWLNERIICTLTSDGQSRAVLVQVTELARASEQVVTLFKQNDILRAGEEIGRVGLRVVAPGEYFLQDHVVDSEFVQRLEAAKGLAPLHVGATLEELYFLQQHFRVPIVGVSDSAFHATKPDYAWNYGLPLADADKFDIKRFGYHGLSVASVMRVLGEVPHLGKRTIVCHLGSGVSVTAVEDGKSCDTTMGYSPLDGAIMATRSGSVDWTAGHALRRALSLDDDEFETYLNTQSGLQGLGGSSDIRYLLELEASGNDQARLALATYVYAIQKAVGQMLAVLGGVDQLVFTGTVGERSAVMRERIVERFEYVNLVLNKQANDNSVSPTGPIQINLGAHPIPIFTVPTGESLEIALRVSKATTR